MIEPTESEDKTELDRFCDALIAIRSEIAAVEAGHADKDNNLLRNSPQTHDFLLEEHWRLPYTKKQEFFPNGQQNGDKYWPPIGRIDNVYGDKHLFCCCP